MTDKERIAEIQDIMKKVCKEGGGERCTKDKDCKPCGCFYWEAKALYDAGYTRQPPDKFWQAIKDAREGKSLKLSEDEFELFSAIQNLALEQQPEPSPSLARVVSEDGTSAIATGVNIPLEPPQDKVKAVENLFKNGVSCVDGCTHFLDESQKRYLVSEILSLVSPELTLISDEERDKAWREGWWNGGGQIGALNSAIQAQLQHTKEGLGGK